MIMGMMLMETGNLQIALLQALRLTKPICLSKFFAHSSVNLIPPPLSDN